MDLKSISSFPVDLKKKGFSSVLLENKMVAQNVECQNCRNMKLIQRNVGFISYRCGKHDCRASKNIREETLFSIAKLRPDV